MHLPKMRISKRIGANSPPDAEPSSGCLAVGAHRAGGYFFVRGERVPGIARTSGEGRAIGAPTKERRRGETEDRNSAVSGKSVTISVVIGGRRIIKKKKNKKTK